MEIYGPDKIHIQQSRLTYNTLYLVRHRLVFHRIYMFYRIFTASFIPKTLPAILATNKNVTKT